MAKRTLVVLQDDLDGSTADQTVSFSLDGVSYEIDLSAPNAGTLREVLAPYMGAGRRLGRPTIVPPRQSIEPRTELRRAAGPARADRYQLGAIRDWARRRGLEVSDRGRIPAHILEQYNAGTTR